MLGNMDWVLLSLVVFTFPWLLKFFIPHKVTLIEAISASALSIVCAFLFFHAGKYVDSMDYELYSGEIVSKSRDHSSYLQAYQCNCKDNKCDTCYRTIYTVDWTAQSNIGDFTIDSEESRYSSVYSTPDPARYTRIYTGEPVSKEVKFINYVKGVPDSIFNESSYQGEFYHEVPAYPRVYDFYRVDRVLLVGNIANISSKVWSDKLSEYQRNWGYRYQANVILIFTDKPIGFVQDVRAKWIQGKQNDLIIIVGLGEGNKIDWVESLGWSENNDIKYSVSSDLMNLKEVTSPDVFFNVIGQNLKNGYKYRDMKKDFSHLESLIEPPLWVIVLTYLVCFGFSVLMMFIELDKKIKEMRR